MACYVATIFICLKVCLMYMLGTFNAFSRPLMDGMCVVPPIHTMMTINGSTFHPKAFLLFIMGRYLKLIILRENLSLHYVSSMNWMVMLGLSCLEGRNWYSIPLIQSMVGLNLALQ